MASARTHPRLRAEALPCPASDGAPLHLPQLRQPHHRDRAHRRLHASSAKGCAKCGFGFLFELLDDYYPAPDAAFFVCDQRGPRDRLRPRLLRAHRPRGRARHRPPGRARCSGCASPTATTRSRPSLEWGVRALGKPVEVNAEGDLPARATADLFPAYDDDGGLLLVLTPARSSRARPMTDRRRNLLDPAARRRPAGRVAGRHRRPSRRGWASTSRAASSSSTRPSPRRSSPRSRGESIDRAIDIMRERVDQLGVAEPEIQRIGPATRSPSRCPASRTPTRRASRSARPPSSTSTTGRRTSSGRAASPRRPTRTSPAARRRARPRPACRSTTPSSAPSGCQPTNNGNETTKGQPTTSSTTRPRQVARRARRTTADLADPAIRGASGPKSAAASDRGRAAGTVVVARREGLGQVRRRPTRFYVLRDDPALSGTDIKNPEQNFDNGAGGTGAPNVTFEFTRQGAQGLAADVTREIAQRGQSAGLRRQTRRRAFQHFAIVLDSEVISAPVHRLQRRTPTASTGGTGSEISGGFTIRLGAGPREPPEDRRAADQARADLASRRSRPRSASRRSTRA